MTAHVAQNNKSRRSAIDEEIFGWMKTVGGFRRTRFHGVARSQMAAYFVGAAYNLLRLTRLALA